MTPSEQLRLELYAAFKNRALLYRKSFDELRRHIEGRVDNGTFEADGFEFSADTWQPGRDGCCRPHICPRTRPAS
jgi:hypothetical protein